MKKWYRIAAVVVVMVAVIAMVIISGVRRSGESEYTRNTITMGTAASFTVYGSHGSENINGMLKLIDSLDKDVLSWRSADSEIYRVNNTYKPDEDITVSSELAGVLKQTLDISRAHDDLLDITIRPLADVWGDRRWQDRDSITGGYRQCTEAGGCVKGKCGWRYVKDIRAWYDA